MKGLLSFSVLLATVLAKPNEIPEKVAYIERGLGAIEIDDGYTSPEAEEFYRSISDRQAPSSYDARTLNLVTPVKNQGGCGSCAAFAATAMHEVAMAKNGAKLSYLDLSEQQLLDCGYNPSDVRNGCNGANAGKYISFFTSSMGGVAAHENIYPYRGTQSNYTCQTTAPAYNSGVKVVSPVIDNACTEAKLKSLVSTYGAAVASVNATDGGFGNYVSGIFKTCTQTSTNHAITVVGYGTDSTNTDYWIIKNSWGPTWGENGYMRLKRNVGMCGIGARCYAAVGSNTGISVTPPAVPSATSCDLSSFYGPLTGSYYLTLITQVSASCKSGICTPNGISYNNACVAFCGIVNCYALN